jgi:hypothetical protein
MLRNQNVTIVKALALAQTGQVGVCAQVVTVIGVTASGRGLVISRLEQSRDNDAPWS